MLARNTTPLTEDFPEDLNEIILSYLVYIVDTVTRDENLLLASLAMGRSIELIQKLVDRNPEHSADLFGWMADKWTYANYVICASLHPDNKVLDLILQKYPEQADYGLRKLSSLRKNKESFECGRLFSPELYGEASRQLFNQGLCSGATITEGAGISFLFNELDEEKTLVGWLKIYEKNIDSLKTAASEKWSIFKTIPYCYSRIKFIERVQEKIYDFLDVERTDISLSDCLSISRDVLGYDVFSKKHESYGVSNAYRVALEARIASIAEVLRKAPMR